MTLLVRIVSYIFILLFINSISFSQTGTTIDWTYVHNTTQEGINALYNLDFDKSQEKFDELMRITSGDPRGYFFSAIRHFFQFMIYNDNEDFDKFFEHSEKVIQICENLIKQNKQDYNAQFFLGGIYGYRGMAYILKQSTLKAVWDGRKGYGLIKDIIKAKPDMYDAYLGSGLFDYILSKIPKSFSWVLSVL